MVSRSSPSEGLPRHMDSPHVKWRWALISFKKERLGGEVFIQ